MNSVLHSEVCIHLYNHLRLSDDRISIGMWAILNITDV